MDPPAYSDECRGNGESPFWDELAFKPPKGTRHANGVDAPSSPRVLGFASEGREIALLSPALGFASFGGGSIISHYSLGETA